MHDTGIFACVLESMRTLRPFRTSCVSLNIIGRRGRGTELTTRSPTAYDQHSPQTWVRDEANKLTDQTEETKDRAEDLCLCQ